MIVDLNLTGKRALVIGGGNESCRKVEALLSQQCEIIVVAEKAKQSIIDHAKIGKITLNNFIRYDKPLLSCHQVNL